MGEACRSRPITLSCLAATVLPASFFDGDLAIFLTHQFFKLTLFTSLCFRGLLIETSLFDLLEETFFSDRSLEALQQFFGGFPAAHCYSDQVSPLSLTQGRDAEINFSVQDLMNPGESPRIHRNVKAL